MDNRKEEREIAFMDWWLTEHMGEHPTFADAIAWADKTMINKACKWLEDWDRRTMFELSMIMGNKFIEDFRKAIEE